MAEQFLDSANIITSFEKVSGKTVAKGVATGGFGSPASPDRFLDRILQILFPDVVPAFLAAAGID